MIIIRAAMRIKPGKEQEAQAAFLEVMTGSQAEPGCTAYTFTADIAETGLIHVLEIWDSEAALHEHFARDAFKTFMGKSGDLVDPVGFSALQGDLVAYELALG